jgi:hypothetical protein
MRVSGAPALRLQMGSSSCHPFRRLGALTGGLRPPAAICTSFGRYSPLEVRPETWPSKTRVGFSAAPLCADRPEIAGAIN